MNQGDPSSQPTLPGSFEARDLRGTAFGPMCSRRLGWSLGINNIPARVCSYSCAYCLAGRIVQMRADRRAFYGSQSVFSAVRSRLEEVQRADGSVDYLTFIPDGEPTLDSGLGVALRLLRPLGIPIAVLTNGSFLSRADVRDALAEADHVSLKIDTVHEATWRKLNRPHRQLQLAPILEGMCDFADGYSGRLTTETMLVGGVNDADEELDATARFIASLHPTTAYVTTPTVKPAEAWVSSVAPGRLARARDVFRVRQLRAEILGANTQQDPTATTTAQGGRAAQAVTHESS